MEQSPARRPSDWVVRFMHLVPVGASVLDLACGAGRHTALFSGLGYPVTAIDRDIAKLGDLAHQKGVEALSIDLEAGNGWPFPDRLFGAIVVTNYLHRPLFASLVAALAPGGVLIYETFAHGNEQFGKPSNPDFLLKPGELLDAVAGTLAVVAYEHGVVHQPRAAVVQRICARKLAEPALLQPH